MAGVSAAHFRAAADPVLRSTRLSHVRRPTHAVWLISHVHVTSDLSRDLLKFQLVRQAPLCDRPAIIPRQRD